ncbi:chloride channel protein [Niveomyces insectorum RCEF 264]|uniref:Chloride channel protein n=1 Tax=Niveomyces insectorum RCEF 264 TaxID=1081102 RepID=A0A167Y218_9HYPO|nr:chloride channel protein [Niveomyces insectorum RCEF 264]
MEPSSAAAWRANNTHDDNSNNGLTDPSVIAPFSYSTSQLPPYNGDSSGGGGSARVQLSGNQINLLGDDGDDNNDDLPDNDRASSLAGNGSAVRTGNGLANGSRDVSMIGAAVDDVSARAQDQNEPLSFVRRQKQTHFLPQSARLFLSHLGMNGTPSSSSSAAYGEDQEFEAQYLVGGHGGGGNGGDSNGNGNGKTHGSASVGVDWYTEGPGRRVGYEDLTAIDWIFEYTKERQRQRALVAGTHGLLGHARRLLDAGQVWVVLVLTGIAAGALAAAIDVASDWLADFKAGYCANAGGPNGGGGSAFYLNHSFCCMGYDEGGLCDGWRPWAAALGIHSDGAGKWFVEYVFFAVLSVTFAVCASLLVKEYAVYAKHSGIPEIKTMLGGFVIRRFLGVWTLVIKSLGLTLSYYFPDKTMWQSFVCAMTAAFVLQMFDPFRSGKLVLYQVTYSSGWHAFELVPYALLGILGGVYGGLFIRANMWVARWKKANSSWLPGPTVQVTLVALLTALINYPNLYMRAQSSELVSNLFSECSLLLDDQFGLCKTGAATASTIVLLLFAAVLGFFLATITFGLQIPAGILLPSMAIGALSGRAVGIVMEIWQRNFPGFLPFQTCAPDVSCVTPGTYAIVGAAAALAGVTRVTVSLVVIVFELTGALTYVLPIMVAVMLSKWVGDAFSRRGIYEAWIHLNEYPLIDPSEELAVPDDVPAAQVMTRIEDLVVLTAAGHTVASLQRVLAAHPYRGFPVVSDPRTAVLLGYISRAELAYTLHAATQPPRSLPPETTEAFFAHQPLADPRTTLDLRPWMDQTPLTLPSRANLHLVVRYFQQLGLRYVLLSDRGVLQGLLTKKDVWYVLNGAEAARRNDADRDGSGDVVNGSGGEDNMGDDDDLGASGGLGEEGPGERRGLPHEGGNVLDGPLNPVRERESIL